MLLLRSHIEFHSANALRFSLSLIRALPIRLNPYILGARVREEKKIKQGGEREREKKTRKCLYYI